MAGDWIKMRTDLRDDPAVISVAASLRIEEDLAVGMLHRLWSWANQQTLDGNAPGVTENWIDRYVGLEGFAKALSEAGWLTVSGGGISIPNFARHNGESAKQRALTAKRVCNFRVTHGALTREEKRREEKSKRARASFTPPTASEVEAYCSQMEYKIDVAHFIDHHTMRGWKPKGSTTHMKDWKAAVRTWVRMEPLFSASKPVEPVDVPFKEF